MKNIFTREALSNAVEAIRHPIRHHQEKELGVFLSGKFYAVSFDAGGRTVLPQVCVDAMKEPYVGATPSKALKAYMAADYDNRCPEGCGPGIHN